MILVTGAGSGIGRGIALACAGDGASVIVADRDEVGGLETVQQLERLGAAALFHPVDISDEPSVQTMIASSLERFGRLDGLVCNAGIGARKLGDGPAHQCTLEAWELVMGVNLRGTFLTIKHSLPALLESKGSIVTLSSVLGLVGTQGLFDTHAYATSKAAIIGLTRSVAAHYAKDGVRANALAPGLIDTAMANRTKSDPALLERVAFWQPLNPLGQIGDVANAATFLLSSQSAFITGAVIPVDGGWTAQ